MRNATSNRLLPFLLATSPVVTRSSVLQALLGLFLVLLVPLLALWFYGPVVCLAVAYVRRQLILPGHGQAAPVAVTSRTLRVGGTGDDVPTAAGDRTPDPGLERLALPVTPAAPPLPRPTSSWVRRGPRPWPSSPTPSPRPCRTARATRSRC
jgi:hypothetical protein